MPTKNNPNFQARISEIEKFIEGVLAKPMDREVKKKILQDLQHYKANLISQFDPQSSKYSNFKNGKADKN